MKLTPPEPAYTRSCGLSIRDKRDGSAKVLNQTFLYTIARKSEVCCTAARQGLIFIR